MSVAINSGMSRRDQRSMPSSTPPKTTAIVRPMKTSMSKALRGRSKVISHSAVCVTPIAFSGYEAAKPSIQPATIA